MGRTMQFGLCETCGETHIEDGKCAYCKSPKVKPILAQPPGPTAHAERQERREQMSADITREEPPALSTLQPPAARATELKLASGTRLWRDDEDPCTACGTKESPYCAKGLCKRCYDREAGQRRREREAREAGSTPLLAPAVVSPPIAAEPSMSTIQTEDVTPLRSVALVAEQMPRSPVFGRWYQETRKLLDDLDAEERAKRQQAEALLRDADESGRLRAMLHALLKQCGIASGDDVAQTNTQKEP